MKKSIYYCKTFKYKDELLKSLMGGHPKEGHLYRHVRDKYNNSYLLIGSKDSSVRFYIPTDGDESRFEFRFINVKPSTFFRIQGIPQVNNPAEYEEWLAKEETEEELQEEGDFPASKMLVDIKKSESSEKNKAFEGDKIYIESVMEDLRTFFPDIYEGFMISSTYMNELLADDKEAGKKKNIEKVQELLDKYKESNNIEDLARLQIVIYSIFNEDNNEGDD